MKKKTLGIIVALNDYKKFLSQNKDFLEELSKNFKKIYIINVIKLRLFNKITKIINKEKFPNNFILREFDTSVQFLNFFKFKEFIGIQYLSKNIEYFKIQFLIKKANIKNIMIMNLGNFGNQQTIEWNLKYLFSAYKHYYNKGFYYIFRILTILNIFPKIDLLFECNKHIIKAHNSGLSRKFESLFPFFKISYFRKIEKINSIFFDNYYENKNLLVKTQKKILYIDTPLNHPDRIERGQFVSSKNIKKFYKNVRSFLIILSKLFNMKIEVCLHPQNLSIKKYFKNLTISKEPTINRIPYSEIVVFSLSSAILSAVIHKKKIINIKSKFLGDYLMKINENYSSSLKLFSHNIDKKFVMSKHECLKKMIDSLSSYDQFINDRLKCDGNNISKKKIIKKIKENFF